MRLLLFRSDLYIRVMHLHQGGFIVLTTLTRDVQLTDPIGGNEGDRHAFNSNLPMWLQRKPTSVTFTLELERCRQTWNPAEDLVRSAKILIGLRGFPQLSNAYPTVEERWAALSRAEQYGLLITAAAGRASNLLARTINDGRVTFTIDNGPQPGTATVTLSWADTIAAWFVDQFCA